MAQAATAALTLDDVDDKIIQGEPEILGRLELDVGLQTKLVKAGVINAVLKDQLNVASLTSREHTHLLLEDIRRGPVEKFLNFCKVVHDHGKYHILDQLSVEIQDIEKQLGIPSSPIKLQQQEIPFVSQKKFYQETLSKVPIYEYSTRPPFCQLDEVFTRLLLVHNDDDGQELKGLCGQRQKSICIEDLFKGMSTSFLRILVEGKPGLGKTTLLKHCAIRWAMENMQTRRGRKGKGKNSKASSEDAPKTVPLLDKELVIFINRSHEGKDLPSTIKNALKGTEQEKEAALEHMQEYPEETFLFFDGIDEFVRKEVVEEVFQLVASAGINILVSCRTGHPYLDNQLQHFNRHVQVDGFNVHGAQTFVKNFMKALTNSVPRTYEKKAERLCVFLASDNVQAFYGSPMNCAFLCILYQADIVSDQELSKLTLTDLFVKQQELLLKRECIKRTKSQKDANDLAKASEVTIQAIQRMALHSLIHEEKHTSYSEEQAEAFGVDLNSPAMVLLQSEIGNTYLTPVKMLSWPHQVIKEFHASGAVKNKAIMYVIASKPELNEVTQFLLAVLLNTDTQAARDLLLAMLFMQSSVPPCAKMKSRGSKKAPKHPCSQIPEIRMLQQERDIEQLLHKSSTESPFSEKTLRITEIQSCLKDTDWALRNYFIFHNLVEMVLNTTTKNEHYQLLKSLLHPFLPSTFSGSIKEGSKVCPWEFDYEEKVNSLYNFRSNLRFELHPVEGRVPMLVLTHLDVGGIVYLGVKMFADKKVSTSVLMILCGSIHDLNHTLDTTDIFDNFNKGSKSKIDQVSIFTNKKNWEWNFNHYMNEKQNSMLWKDVILKLNNIFTPRRGFYTEPEHTKVLSIEDQEGLAERDIFFQTNIV